ncbi:hypothetical protein [Methanopyrus sp. KOL6]|uniref:hypothetical protein n=1 Tax=Methanopyrus sp. KOL6 TaxID=1937004 RepID=UPI000B4ADFD1|nr:hypothetical protein [Methanopyrus sp. KOL6]
MTKDYIKTPINLPDDLVKRANKSISSTLKGAVGGEIGELFEFREGNIFIHSLVLCSTSITCVYYSIYPSLRHKYKIRELLIDLGKEKEVKMPTSYFKYAYGEYSFTESLREGFRSMEDYPYLIKLLKARKNLVSSVIKFFKNPNYKEYNRLILGSAGDALRKI